MAEKMEIMSREQVQRWFDENSCIVHKENMIPLFRLAGKFGDDAAEYARKCGHCVTVKDEDGLPYTADFFTLAGTMEAATFNNIELLDLEEYGTIESAV